MSTSAVDRLLKLVSSLHAHGPQYPGKPPAFKPETPLARRKLIPVVDEKGNVIAYSRASCGASQTQTKSANMGGFSPLDIAAAAGLAHLDPDTRTLFEFIAGNESRRPVLAMVLAAEIYAEAKFRRIQLPDGMADKIADLVLEMLMDADGCKYCNTSGVVLGEDGKACQCPRCRGAGHDCVPERTVAARWGLSQPTYHRNYAQIVHWAHAVMQGRVATIYANVMDSLQ